MTPPVVSVPFVKMHGLGNDYVYLDERELTPLDLARRIDAPAWARVLAERHTGIGGDGLIILRAHDTLPCRMEMLNADGSRAEMCGNGLRCVARLAWERGYTRGARRFELATDAGTRAVEVHPEAPGFLVSIDMGAPTHGEEPVLESAGRSFRGQEVSVGNPHLVVEIDEDLDAFPVERYGPPLERHARFPQRINVEFVRVLAPDRLALRVWERGSGETRACGTGATAAACALMQSGRLGPRATVHLRGGDLIIERAPDGASVIMTGPATFVCAGVFPLSLVG